MLSKAEAIRHRIEKQDKQYWQIQDFPDLPMTTVAKTLSRLTQKGYLTRVSKGVYYRPKMTRFGQTHPSQTGVQELLKKTGVTLYPAGISAANFLGLTTQNTPYGEFATSASSLPLKLLGERAKLHTRRPANWHQLNVTEAALLDSLRNRGIHSEFPPQETMQKILDLLNTEEHFENIMAIATTEPPRVRAILGAMGQTLKKDSKQLQKLKRQLNPLSRFDFGLFKELPFAEEWQAK
ncbi:DUF6088 family protein [[Limnothrix rosea] IAM M-220]|uniref:DUF6088 family protein n=1 Tax=[Limnothrix rosea] IAM M-220 TaxID=454133 RepID=UPI000969B239|nr:DUF6088 family protein [[Limnothrix rosea] IAM M-220]OKH17656.1 hypothetical protein NIES208_08355 [[Limnothrix rosea] IAM M-220]